MAQDIPEDVYALIAKHNPAVAESLERLKPIRRARYVSDRTPEEMKADDYTWLWDFEYEGKKLTAKEITFLIAFAGTGFENLRHALYEAGMGAPTDPWMNATLNAALHEMTKDSVRQWQSNAGKVGRLLFNILNAKITDVIDVTPGGIVAKDLSKVHPDTLDAIQEIHETRNHQGVQLRVKMYDKIAAAGTAMRMLGMHREDTLRVEFSVLDERLSTALQRISRDPEALEGEVVTDV